MCAAPGTVLAAPDRALLPVPVRTLSAGDHGEAWARAVPSLADRSTTLAARHPLDPARTAELAADHGVADGLDLAGVSRLVRARATAALPTGTWLTTPDVPWQQVVLPPEGALQLHDAVARLDHQHTVLDGWGMRGRAHAVPGARLLLSGPPGTGKSLAAAAVATALETDLLVVDVSRIVSKWLGETEKNLSAVFDAAERTQAVLLLDEADALFATRTEVSDAHDRYANLETAYLLQRLDRFEGLVILTSNLRGNIDVAFVRRMDFVVDFPLPDLGLRHELWRLHLPDEHVAADVDAPSLARLYAVPSAWIRTARSPRRTPPPPAAAPCTSPTSWPRCAASSRRPGALPGRAREERTMTGCVESPTCTCSCSSADLAVNPFVALRVAYGMLLGVDDLDHLMGDPRGKQMVHSSWLHGTGVVWGYGVRCSDDGRSPSLQGWPSTVSAGAVLPRHHLPRPLRPGCGLGEGRSTASGAGTLSVPRRGGPSRPHPQGLPQEDQGVGLPQLAGTCLVASFDTCLASPVPTPADPCDVTRKHDDYSRVVERVRFGLVDGCCDRRTHDYHRVRVLLGLDPVGSTPADEEATDALEEVLAAPASERVSALLEQFRRMAALNAVDRRRRVSEDGCAVVFPSTRRTPACPWPA